VCGATLVCGHMHVKIYSRTVLESVVHHPRAHIAFVLILSH
jgi:hypothetical protein